MGETRRNCAEFLRKRQTDSGILLRESPAARSHQGLGGCIFERGDQFPSVLLECAGDAGSDNAKR